MAEDTRLGASPVLDAGPAPAATASPTPAALPSPAVPTKGVDAGLGNALRSYVGDVQKGRADLKQATAELQGIPLPKMTELPKPPQTKTTDFMEMFGSAAMGLAGLGSLMTRRPLTNALNAGAAVMQAYHKNDMEAAQKAYQNWEVETQNAMRLHQFEQEAYRNAVDKSKTNVDELRANLTGLAASFKDDVALSMLNRGDTQGALALITGRQQLGARASEAQLQLQDAMERRKDLAQLETVQDPEQKAALRAQLQEKWFNREHLGDAPKSATAARNAEYTTGDGTKATGAVQQQTNGTWATLDGIPVTPVRFVGTATTSARNTSIDAIAADRAAQFEQSEGRAPTEAEKAQMRLDVERDLKAPGGYTPPVMVTSTAEGGEKVFKLAQQNKATGQWVAADEKRTPIEGVVSVAKPHEMPPTDDPSVKSVAKQIADYRQPPLSSFAMRSPWGQAVMAEVGDINPTYNAPRYNEINKAVSAFATGVEGRTLRSFNVATEHLGTLETLVDALGTGDVKTLNSASNAFSKQFGGTAPVNFEAAKRIVADEVVKAIVGGGGALADREAAAATIDAAMTPDQLRGVIKQYKELMGGQLTGLKLQYEQTTGRDDFDQRLTPAARTAMKATRSGGAGSAKDNPISVTSEDQANKLPNGTWVTMGGRVGQVKHAD